MSRTPYTDDIAARLGINTDELARHTQTHGATSPLGQCADAIQNTLWDMQSAERTAAEAVADLSAATKVQAANLAGTGNTFDPSWLATYADRAKEAGAKLTAGVERLRTFKRLIDVLAAQIPAA